MEHVACKMLSALHFFKLLSLIDLSILRVSNNLLLILKRRDFQMCAAIGMCWYLQRRRLIGSYEIKFHQNTSLKSFLFLFLISKFFLYHFSGRLFIFDIFESFRFFSLLTLVIVIFIFIVYFV